MEWRGLGNGRWAPSASWALGEMLALPALCSFLPLLVQVLSLYIDAVPLQHLLLAWAASRTALPRS